jgi:Flp pilus assembly protein TadD
MRGRRLVSIASLAAILIGAAACSDTTTPVAGKTLGSKKPLRVGDRDARIGKADPDLALMTSGEPPKKGDFDTGTLVRLGDAATKRGQYPAAAIFYDRAVRRSPKNVGLRKKLGFALFRARDLQRSEAVFRSTLKLAPDDPAVLRGLANIKVAQGEPEAAIPIYRRALKASRGRAADHRIYNGLGVAFDLTGRHGEAQRTYRRGLAQAPKNGSLRNNFALSLAAAGNYSRAVHMLEDLVRENAGSAKYRRNLERVRARAAKAGVKVSKREVRPAPKPATRPAKAEPVRRVAARTAPKRPAPRRTARAVGPPRRLVPKSLPDIKMLAARNAAPGDEPPARPEATQTAKAPAPRAVTKAPKGVTDPSDRELLARLHPGAKPPADAARTPPSPSSPARKARTRRPRTVAQADKAAARLARLAPAAGDPAQDDDLGNAEKADRQFLRALRGGRPRRK